MADLTGATVLRKTSDETVNNSAALQDDDDLKFAVAANEVWYFEGMLIHVGNGTADFKFAFTVPSGAALHWMATYAAPGAAADAQIALVEVSGTSSPTCDAGTSNAVVLFKGEVRVGGTADDLQLQWAQANATVVDTKLLTGSYMICAKEA